MTGTQKQKRHAELCETTRVILGRTTVPAAQLRNIDLRAGTAEVHLDGRAYEAVKGLKSFHLNGNYTTI